MTLTSGQAEQFYELMPLTRKLGIEVLQFSPELVRARIAWAEELCTAGGHLHGGALMSLADACGGACAFLNLPAGSKATSTIESKTNFFRGVSEGWVNASSRPLHSGRRVIVVETLLEHDDESLIAKTTQSQIVI